MSATRPGLRVRCPHCGETMFRLPHERTRNIPKDTRLALDYLTDDVITVACQCRLTVDIDAVDLRAAVARAYRRGGQQVRAKAA